MKRARTRLEARFGKAGEEREVRFLAPPFRTRARREAAQREEGIVGSVELPFHGGHPLLTARGRGEVGGGAVIRGGGFFAEAVVRRADRLHARQRKASGSGEDRIGLSVAAGELLSDADARECA